MKLSPSSLIFVAIIAGWVAYLVPQWIRRREQLQASRTHDRHSRGARVLEPRPARSHGDGASSEPIHRRKQVNGEATEAAAHHVLAVGRRPRGSAHARAARRRLLVLLTLVVVTVLTGVAAAFPQVPNWLVLPGALLLTLDVVAIVLSAPGRRRRVQRQRAAARAASLAAARGGAASSSPEGAATDERAARRRPPLTAVSGEATTDRAVVDPAAAGAGPGAVGSAGTAPRRQYVADADEAPPGGARVQARGVSRSADAAQAPGMAGTGTETWTPVPVPRPTYTLKPTAPRPMPRPLGAPEASVRLITSESASGSTSGGRTATPAAHVPVVESAPPTLNLDAVLARRRAANA